MIDIRDADVHFRGYPVLVMGEQCHAFLRTQWRRGDGSPGLTHAGLLEVLGAMADTAELGEVHDWYFTATYHDQIISLERFTDTDLGEGWSMFLPSER